MPELLVRPLGVHCVLAVLPMLSLLFWFSSVPLSSFILAVL